MIMKGSTNRKTSILSRVLLAGLAIIVLPFVPSLAQDGKTSVEKTEVAVANVQEDAKDDNCCVMSCFGVNCIFDCISKCNLDDCNMKCVSCKMETGKDGKTDLNLQFNKVFKET